MSKHNVYFGFARRQTPESRFSHTILSEAEVINLIEANWDNLKPTYRKYNPDTSVCDQYGLPFGGVVKVPVEPAGFFSAVVTLQEGDKLAGVFEARKEGEEPRKVHTVKAPKAPAKSVEIILYHRLVLAEDEPDRDFRGDWEVVSINCSPTEDNDIPIGPMTLLHNHFGSTGGTSTGLSDSELVEQLRVGFLYWKDKAMTG